MLNLGRFCATYPGLNPFHGWPSTRDGAIPCRVFFALYRAIPHVSAGLQLERARATSTAIATSFDGDKSAARELIENAYPEIQRGD